MKDIIIDAKQLEAIIVGAAIVQGKSVLEGWKSPLEPIILDAFKVNDGVIRQKIYAAVEGAVRDENFTASLREALNHKLANLVIQKCSGLVEKSFNNIMQDPILRTKLQTEVVKILEGGKPA